MTDPMRRNSPSATDVQAFAAVAEACAAVALRGVADAGPKQATPPVDTAGVERMAGRHRISTLALAELARRMHPHDPAVAARLAERARRLRLGALQHAAQLVTVTAALAAEDIRYLAIKGAVLAQQIHGDIAARNSKDIDLLVDPAMMDRAATTLHRLGYAELKDGVEIGPFTNKHRTFVGHGLEIEVHSRLIDVDALLPLPFDTIWARRETLAIGGAPVAALSAADTLLYLCAHGASHLWFRLKWLEDIARIVAIGDPAPIEAARATARAAGAEAVVLGALALVEDMFGIAMPGAPLPNSQASRALVRLSRRALAAPAEHASTPPLGAILRKLPVQFSLSVSWRYRARLAQTLILAPRDFDVRTLPKGLGWLRLPLRPLMLLMHRARRA